MEYPYLVNGPLNENLIRNKNVVVDFTVRVGD
jgi:hypothetical protein